MKSVSSKKPKLLLIEPGVKITKHVPIGILVLAGFIRAQGYPVAVKEYSGKEISEQVIKKEIIRENPDFVGIRVLTGPFIPRALKISRIAKQLGKKVIWGGPHPTILPEQTLKHPFIDAVVIGEGEYALLDLLRYYQNNKIKPLGCGIKEKNSMKFFPPQKRCVNLELSPLPAWDLLKNINEHFPSKKGNSLKVMSSRGCAFKCAFCHNSNENVRKYLGGYRVISAKRVLDEYEFVQSLIKNKITMLDAGGDYHLVSKEYTKNWCETMKKRAPHLKWSTCGRFANIDHEMIGMIADANCVDINLGVESGSRRIQQLNNKIIDLKTAILIARHLRKRKIFLTNTYIFGHPTETFEELKQTRRYIRKLPADLNLIQIYRPFPGTPYYSLCIKEGKVIPFNKLSDWNTFGTMIDNVNMSRIPDFKLFFYFYAINLLEQLKEFRNRQVYYLRNGFYREFFGNFVANRFIKKFKEILENYGL